MLARCIVNNLLAELGEKLHIPQLVLSESGTCAFDYKDELKVVIELPEGSELVYVYAPFMPIPHTGQKKLFRKLLRLNLFCYDTNGSAFAISDKLESVLLCYSHRVETLDQVTFENILENFLNTLERLHADIANEQYIDDDEHEPGLITPLHFIKA